MDGFFIQTNPKGLNDDAKQTLQRFYESLQPESLYQIFYQKITVKSNSQYKYLHGHIIPMISTAMYRQGTTRIIDSKGQVWPIDCDSLYKIIMTEYFYNYTEINGNFYKLPGKARKMSNAEMTVMLENICARYAEQYHIVFLTQDEFFEQLEYGNRTSAEIVDIQLRS